jgi:hypothetical protein
MVLLTLTDSIVAFPKGTHPTSYPFSKRAPYFPSFWDYLADTLSTQIARCLPDGKRDKTPSHKSSAVTVREVCLKKAHQYLEACSYVLFSPRFNC